MKGREFMKKTLFCVIAIALVIVCLTSCDWFTKDVGIEWKYSDTHHWWLPVFPKGAAGIQIVYGYGEHCDDNGDLLCDVCGYSYNSADVAQIVIDYEQTLMKDINQLEKNYPEYDFLFNPIYRVRFTFVLEKDCSAEDIVEKYNMNDVFSMALISTSDYSNTITLGFFRDDLTNGIYAKIKQISKQESLVTDLRVEYEKTYHRSYMPKIEYYTEDASELSYTPTNRVFHINEGKDVIIKSKEEYDSYLDCLLELAKFDSQKESINNARDLYDESFFEENALIFTKIIVRGSGSIQLTVNNLYISGNKAYVVVRTDEPTMGTDDMQFRMFGFIVNQNDVVNVDEVITLE